MSDDTGEWHPEPATLRDGEHADVSSHAQRNIEQIRQFERDGVIDSETAEERIAAIKEKDTTD